MISSKKFEVDGNSVRFMSDFIIKSLSHTRVYIYKYDNTCSVGGTCDTVDSESGYYIREVDAPQEADLVSTDKYSLIDNSIVFFERFKPINGLTLWIEVASNPEEFSDVLITPALQQALNAVSEAESARDLAQTYRDEAEGFKNESETFRNEAEGFRDESEQIKNDLITSNPVKSVKDFGAVGDGVTDDTVALQSAFDSNEKYLVIPSGNYIVSDTLTIDSDKLIEGLGTGFDVKFTYIGTGTKAVYTKVKHPNDGTDDPISVGLHLNSSNIILSNLMVQLNVDYGDTSPSNLGDNWDVGILVQYPYTTLIKTRTRGYWRKAGTLLDNTRDNGNTDGVYLENCRFQGRYSLMIKGPDVEIGQSEIDNTTDFRGKGGISDFLAVNCYFEGMNHHSGVRPYDVDAGCLYIDGKVDPGTAQINAIQGHRFIGTRFYSFDPYTINLDSTIRDSFKDCFIERITGKFQSDGITPAGDGDVITYSSSNTKLLRLFGTDMYRTSNQLTRDNGFYLEQTSNQNLSQTTARAEGIHEYPQGVKLGTAIGNTPLDYYNEGVFTPTLDFGTGITYTKQEGRYTRIGDLVFLEIDLTISAISNTDGSDIHFSIPFDNTAGFVIGNLDYNKSTLFNFSTHNELQFSGTGTRMTLTKNDGTTYKYNTAGLLNASGDIKLTLQYKTTE